MKIRHYLAATTRKEYASGSNKHDEAMRIKVNLKMLLELLLRPPSPPIFFSSIREGRFVKCHLAVLAGWGARRLWSVKGGKLVFLFWSSFGNWAASTEV